MIEIAGGIVLAVFILVFVLPLLCAVWQGLSEEFYDFWGSSRRQDRRGGERRSQKP